MASTALQCQCSLIRAWRNYFFSQKPCKPQTTSIGQLYQGCGSMMGSSPRFMHYSKSESYLRYGTEYYLYAPVNIFVLAWDAAWEGGRHKKPVRAPVYIWQTLPPPLRSPPSERGGAQHGYLFSSVGCVMENLSKYFSHFAFTDQGLLSYIAWTLLNELKDWRVKLIIPLCFFSEQA